MPQSGLNGLLGEVVGSRDSLGEGSLGWIEAGAELSVYVEEIMALMKFGDGKDPVVAKLARAVLILVESLREAEMRAGLAEASLEAERAAHAAAVEPVRQHVDAA